MDKQRHIVVVDDDTLIRTLLLDILSGANYKVTTYASGAEFLKDVPHLTPSVDAIILDRIMPSMSGLEVLNKLCAIPLVRNIPVIMLTSSADQYHVEKAQNLGVFDLIFKPINTTQLLDTLQQAIQETSQYIFE